MKNRISTILATAALFASLSVATSLRAAPVTFTIDPSQSSLTLSGAAFGLGYNPQVSGSLLDYFSGTITADVTGGVLTFSGGSSISALLHPLGPFSTSPAPYPTGGDNYGVAGSGFVTGYGLVNVNGVYRSLALDITGGTAAHGSPAVLNLAFTAGRLDWGATTGLGPTGGTSSMVGVAGTNATAATVSFDGITLMMPINLFTTGQNRYEFWTGTLVAVVPEPSSAALGVLGLGAMLAARNLRRANRSR